MTERSDLHSTAADAPERSINLFDCVCIIVGVIIGSGIYRTTPLIAGSAGSIGILMLMWLGGGLIVLNGALCYVELVAGYRRRGGDFAYLSLAYGRWMGFIFAWTEFWIIRPGNVGAMAMVYSEYAQQLAPWGADGQQWHALAAVVALTVMHLLGMRTGKWTQNMLTVLKVAGLAALIGAGLMYAGEPATEATSRNIEWSGINLALILVLFTYGGWNDISYVATEVRDPDRNLWRAMVAGVALVVLIYVLVNLAMLRVLGLDGVIASDAVAAATLTRCVGAWGGAAISVLICVSCLGAISAMMFTGSRIYQAMGAETRALKWLSHWDSRRGVPARSVVAQAAVIVLLLLLLGGANGFERLVAFAAPFFWLFFTLVAIAIFVMRFKDPLGPRPVRAWLYPVGPLLFVVSCGYLLYSSVNYVFVVEANPKLPLYGLATQLTCAGLVLISGLVILATNSPRPPAES